MNMHDISPLLSSPGMTDAAALREHEKQTQAAQDFESLILTRLLSEMKETIGDWGMEKDNSTQQIHGLFWMQLAQNLADQGGVGLGRQMLSSMQSSTAAPANTELDTAL